jgi:hypothetical protein
MTDRDATGLQPSKVASTGFPRSSRLDGAIGNRLLAQQPGIE